MKIVEMLALHDAEVSGWMIFSTMFRSTVPPMARDLRSGTTPLFFSGYLTTRPSG